MSTKEINISVIVAAYNYEPFLEAALESIRQQSFQQWECIIIDDGSTDGSAAVAQRFAAEDARFIYAFQENQGIAASRNKGIAMARGAYIQLLDSDDLIQAHKLEYQKQVLDSHPEVSVVYGDALFFATAYPDQHYYSRRGATKRPQRPAPEAVQKLLLRDNFLVISAPLMRRRIFDEGILFDTGFSTYEDWKFWMDVSTAGHRFLYTDAPDTATLIRFGHSSLMTKDRQMNLGARKLRRALNHKLNPGDKAYNYYRQFRLFLKALYLRLSGK